MGDDSAAGPGPHLRAQGKRLNSSGDRWPLGRGHWRGRRGRRTHGLTPGVEGFGSTHTGSRPSQPLGPGSGGVTVAGSRTGLPHARDAGRTGAAASLDFRPKASGTRRLGDWASSRSGTRSRGGGPSLLTRGAVCGESFEWKVRLEVFFSFFLFLFRRASPFYRCGPKPHLCAGPDRPPRLGRPGRTGGRKDIEREKFEGYLLARRRMPKQI